jgi:hypothetical protein
MPISGLRIVVPARLLRPSSFNRNLKWSRCRGEISFVRIPHGSPANNQPWLFENFFLPGGLFHKS